MKVAVFSTKRYDRDFLSAETPDDIALTFFEPRLTEATAMLAHGYEAICVFVNDVVNRSVITQLAANGLKLIALRCAGFNNVDLTAAREHDVTVVRVPGYSPHSVAEHTVALLLMLNRKTHRAYNRVRDGNFALDGLLGFDIYGQTVGVVGTGKIGIEFARIMRGFGCDIVASDPYPNPALTELGGRYLPLEAIWQQADIISLHAPLTPQTHHMISAAAIEQMKKGVVILNTSRGALVDTPAVIDGLKSGHIGYLGLDVYEEEADLFFEDLSDKVIQDDQFSRLLTFPNVVITGHQAFFTREALSNIAATTLNNIDLVRQGAACPNVVRREKVVSAADNS